MSVKRKRKHTVLDFLNEDCWRAVLQYVPVQDVIRTERTSRGWQGVVLTYLRGVRITFHEYTQDEKLDSCYIPRKKYKSFESWTKKLGPSVVATYCIGLRSLATIKVNCPNIEDLKLKVNCRTAKQLRPHNLSENFKSLKRLCFEDCYITDYCVSVFLSDKALQELTFFCCDQVYGACFQKINLSRLKSLEIKMSNDFKAKHVVPAFDRLGELTKLKFDCISVDFLDDIQCGLDKMSKLEELDLNDDPRMTGECGEQVSRLTRLRRLRLAYQMFDVDVEAITRCCQDLVELDLCDCRALSSYCVEPIWRNAGARLTALQLWRFDAAKDDDIIALIRGCPLLTTLAVTGPLWLTRRLPERAAAARRRVAAAGAAPLELDISYSNLVADRFGGHSSGEDYGPYPDILKKIILLF